MYEMSSLLIQVHFVPRTCRVRLAWKTQNGYQKSLEECSTYFWFLGLSDFRLQILYKGWWFSWLCLHGVLLFFSLHKMINRVSWPWDIEMHWNIFLISMKFQPWVWLGNFFTHFGTNALVGFSRVSVPSMWFWTFKFRHNRQSFMDRTHWQLNSKSEGKYFIHLSHLWKK